MSKPPCYNCGTISLLPGCQDVATAARLELDKIEKVCYHMHDMNNQPLYTVTEAAQKLGIHPDTLRRWHKSGIAFPLVLPGGNHRRFTQGEIERLALLAQPEAQEA